MSCSFLYCLYVFFIVFFFFFFSLFFFFFFFFFSSRRRHTRFDCDWSFRRVLFRSRRLPPCRALPRGYRLRHPKPSSWVARPIQLSSHPIARASAARASCGRLFCCERCAPITCLSRERYSAASRRSESTLSRCPNGPAMRAFSHFGYPPFHSMSRS